MWRRSPASPTAITSSSAAAWCGAERRRNWPARRRFSTGIWGFEWLSPAGTSQNEGEQRNPNSSEGGDSGRLLLGCVLFFVGAIFAKLADEITNQPTCGREFMTAALIMWVIVAVLVIQGTILSLSGEWIWQLHPPIAVPKMSALNRLLYRN